MVDAAYFTGRTDGSEFVEVRARVSGYLTKVLFQPGTRISKGDPLFEIDDRPYRVSLDQAEAELERAKARLTRTNLDLARNEKLVKIERREQGRLRPASSAIRPKPRRR